MSILFFSNKKLEEYKKREQAKLDQFKTMEEDKLVQFKAKEQARLEAKEKAEQDKLAADTAAKLARLVEIELAKLTELKTKVRLIQDKIATKERLSQERIQSLHQKRVNTKKKASAIPRTATTLPETTLQSIRLLFTAKKSTRLPKYYLEQLERLKGRKKPKTTTIRRRI